MRTDERRWILLRTFYQSYRTFHALFDEYERRVQHFAERYGVDRKELQLPPDEILSLFDAGALLALRDGELELLRDSSHRLFRGSSGASEPFDNHVATIYHEVSILKEEHNTLREDAMREDLKEYGRYYREVNIYYPKRLKHVRNLYGKARKRLEQILPGMSRSTVVVRSTYLFGARLVGDVYRRGLEQLYGHMYPERGPVGGFAVAGDSFLEGGFGAEAAEAYRRAIAALDRESGAGEHADGASPTEEERADLVRRRERALALV